MLEAAGALPERARRRARSSLAALPPAQDRGQVLPVSSSSQLSMASIFFSEMIAPFDLHHRFGKFVHAPPQAVHFFHKGSFVGPLRLIRLDFKLNNADTLEAEIASPDRSKPQPIRFFRIGEQHNYWKLFTGQLPPDLSAGEGARCSCSAPTGSGARHMFFAALALRRAHLFDHRPLSV